MITLDVEWNGRKGWWAQWRWVLSDGRKGNWTTWKGALMSGASAAVHTVREGKATGWRLA